MSPVQSGLLLLIYMLANLCMKTVTNPILRRFGIRDVLVWNGLIASVAIAACALIGPGVPFAATALLLLIAGGSRSMQFTAATMITFADVPPQDRASASVLFSLCQQLGMSMGVAVGASMLSISEAFRGANSLGVFDFRLALVLTGVISALSIWPVKSVPRDAGAEISGHKLKTATAG